MRVTVTAGLRFGTTTARRAGAATTGSAWFCLQVSSKKRETARLKRRDGAKARQSREAVNVTRLSRVANN